MPHSSSVSTTDFVLDSKELQVEKETGNALSSCFRKLQIEVDHRRLMSEKSVPVGVFYFLYEYIFR